MNSYLIYTDSAADIPVRDLQSYEIKIIPMDYMVNGEDATFFTDQEHDAVCDRLYAAMREGADVHTSQITPYRFEEYWRKGLEAGLDILHLCFSSGLSATYTNAMQAASALQEEFPQRKIQVVDTLAATAGQGVYVVCACMNREQGMSLEENVSWLEENKKYLCHRFVVGDLDYLHKGGRVSAAVALIGGMLKIKPILIIDDEGKLEMVQKARGQQAALKALVKSYQNEMGVPGLPKLIFLSHTSQYEEVERLKQMLLEVAEPGTRVETICETPIIGVHTGPEFFSVCGFGFHRKEQA
ncbi:MAG: DegV family protein [Blautia sp.]|nr:DegV family protein [Blautia sp.]